MAIQVLVPLPNKRPHRKVWSFIWLCEAGGWKITIATVRWTGAATISEKSDFCSCKMEKCVVEYRRQMNIWMKHSGNWGNPSRRSNALRCPCGRRPNVDRALETPIQLGAEGASVTTPNSQAKGQRFSQCFFDGSCSLHDPFVFYQLFRRKYGKDCRAHHKSQWCGQ